jgi:hypothetical protein
LKEGCICVVYVDDTIFAGPDAKMLEQEIRSLGVASDECDHSFQLKKKEKWEIFLESELKNKRGMRFF